MKPKLILHAGTHKTGTTAIQAFAARHRAALAARGVLYPDLTPIGLEHNYPQHLFAHALAGKGKTRLSPGDAVRVAGLWAEAAAETGATVFLSSEPLYRYSLREPGDDWRAARGRYLDRLAEALAPFDVETVLVFRRPDDYVRSLFQENVMRASRPKWESFPAFRDHALGGALRYADNAALFAERFPSLTCLIYEDLPRGPEFCQAFFAAIGVDARGLEPVGVVRESLTPAETQAKIVLNRADFDPSRNGRVVKWLKSKKISGLISGSLGSGPFGIWEDASARDAFLAAAAPGMERLRAQVFPDRETLFPSGRAALPPMAPELDADAAADLMARATAEVWDGVTPAAGKAVADKKAGERRAGAGKPRGDGAKSGRKGKKSGAKAGTKGRAKAQMDGAGDDD